MDESFLSFLGAHEHLDHEQRIYYIRKLWEVAKQDPGFLEWRGDKELALNWGISNPFSKEASARLRDNVPALPFKEE